MPDPPADHRSQMDHDPYYEPDLEGLGLVDGIRFLYQRRMRLALYFLLFFAVGFFAFLFNYLSSSKSVSATVALRFAGIEKQEYPSGRKFSVEDFRSPDLLTKAMEAAAIGQEQIKPLDLAAHIFVTPVIPADIQNIWKKQERDGTRKEEYAPSEFNLRIGLAGLSDAEQLRLFDAVVKQYRERVKFDQESALGFVPDWNTSYEELATVYDFWDIPELFNDTYDVLKGRTETVIDESLQFKDPKYQLAFRNIVRNLNTWYGTRLLALQALTYQGGLVKNKAILEQRLRYQIDDLDIQISQKKRESDEASKLLETIEQPRVLLAGQLSNRDGTPMIDASALDRLVKSDYVGPVVERISTLQGEVQEMEGDKARLQKQLGWLPKSRNMTLDQLPPPYKDLVDTLSSELKQITQDYNNLLDEYLTATITSKVLITQSPILSRGGYSPILVLAGILFLSAIAALFCLALGHLLSQVRGQQRSAVS